MITAFVQFQLAPETTLDAATAIFRSTAPRYLGLRGLIRKHYIFDPQNAKAGGFYVFENRAAAEAVFDDAWRALVNEKYGCEPELTFFDSPVCVDNVKGEIMVLPQ
ncbi:YdhR family protein [Rhodobium gokarnense]|uniref:Monooxygenase n=1 Tax=Rhodobium gokarnense TaxID=364296 RepID=A0ABT3HCF9_9HYPH|nr:YdhR family protein [Rhodobium gokarnense]MCW2308075.1 hypothetical protein [Rhodobium gokarnense]